MPDIVLMGLRGSGKSTIGRRLAQALGGWAFIDLDTLVLESLGMQSVAEAWTRLGEPAFRDAEAHRLDGLLAASGVEIRRVIALGGGTPMIPAARDAIEAARHAGSIRGIYLHASPAELAPRLRTADPNRPPLTSAADPLDEIQAMYAARDPVYRQLADRIVEAAQPVESIVATLTQIIRHQGWHR